MIEAAKLFITDKEFFMHVMDGSGLFLFGVMVLALFAYGVYKGGN